MSSLLLLFRSKVLIGGDWQGNGDIYHVLLGDCNSFVRDTISSDSSAARTVHFEASTVPRPAACSASQFLQETTLSVGSHFVN